MITTVTHHHTPCEYLYPERYCPVAETKQDLWLDCLSSEHRIPQNVTINELSINYRICGAMYNICSVLNAGDTKDHRTNSSASKEVTCEVQIVPKRNAEARRVGYTAPFASWDEETGPARVHTAVVAVFESQRMMHTGCRVRAWKLTECAQTRLKKQRKARRQKSPSDPSSE